ncbi:MULTISPECIES: glycosyltransferase family 2 protein [unclassified Beijerinckia]|uniref:glycosyltransferase family 2 protein n=1 Tax=unclassified Beijerinckia TaxID=2638183 RepID=UPI0008947440|nr:MULTISPECIES: glycosyltransferase family 2 protein [unclassified Beijerinckia]MDH7797982.1 glycosyltransferase involved in cell wall biosynthesis [Beijerinckia sp. GAS462]SED04898.1 Glycosyl transferase family 2 [Beijerinckia sp. 28-YEA-48]
MQSADVKITVVVPTYNRRDSLKKALESVLQETRVSIQVHVFDNASTDGTEEYVSSLARSDSRVTYFRNGDNVGPTANFQRALGSIKSDYFVPLADDDWLLPDFLWKAASILDQDRELGAAIFVSEVRNEDGDFLGTYPSPLDKLRFGKLTAKEHLRDWMTFGHYAWSSILWRSDVLRFIGYPYLHAGLPSDIDFQTQVFSEFPVYITTEPGAVFVIHPKQGGVELDITHVPSWSRILRRLDAQVIKNRLFDLHEYLAMRNMVVARHCSSWRKPTAKPVQRKAHIKLAVLAGVVLNDWDFALEVAAKLPPENAGVADAKSKNCFYFLPQMHNGDQRAPASGVDELILSTMRWAAEARRALEAQTNHTSSLTETNRVLAEKNETLRNNFEQTSTRLDETTRVLHKFNDHCLSLGRNRLFRLLVGLRLLPRL